MTWKRCPIRTVRVIHIIPLDDMQAHFEHFGCWCVPNITDDGVVVHIAADGREQFETGERMAS
jgi:hypothetical protein